MGDGDPVREAGRAARILEIGDIVRAGGGKLGLRPLALGEALPGFALHARRLRCRGGHSGELVGIEEMGRIGAVELDLELVDIGIAASERGRQRQRHRPGAGIDGAEEEGGELRAGLGDDRDPVLRPHPRRDQPPGGGERVGAELGIRIGADQHSARIVEVEAANAPGRIIERVPKRFEVGEAARQRVRGRRRKQCLGHGGSRILSVVAGYARSRSRGTGSVRVYHRGELWHNRGA